MSYGVVNRPQKPGATMRVWELADEITDRKGRTARRKEVIDAYVAENGNPNTASTQFYYWKDARTEAGQQTATASPPESQGAVFRLRLGQDGAVRLPDEVLRAMGLRKGAVVAARLEEGELRLAEPVAALRRVQEALRPLADHLRAEGRSVVEELISERRSEALREDKG